MVITVLFTVCSSGFVLYNNSGSRNGMPFFKANVATILDAVSFYYVYYFEQIYGYKTPSRRYLLYFIIKPFAYF